MVESRSRFGNHLRRHQALGNAQKAGTAGAAKMKVETKDHIIFPRRRLEDLLLPRNEDVVVPSATLASLDPKTTWQKWQARALLQSSFTSKKRLGDAATSCLPAV